MKSAHSKFLFAVLLATLAQAINAACPDLQPEYDAPRMAEGWKAQLIARNLTAPRGIVFDNTGRLLIIEKSVGVVYYEFDDGGSSCLTKTKNATLVASGSLNHGIALSQDGKTLYASSSEAVYSWEYNSDGPSVSDTNKTLVKGMSNGDHTSRTLLISNKQPEILVVSRGSGTNIDEQAETLSTGHSQVKAFDLSKLTADSDPYDFTTSGILLGWGLRNSVGVAEEPITGGIYTVENSADEIQREGVDIHQNNPGEEMNFHGFLNDTTARGNYGYPNCFALWNTSIPDAANLTVGSQFVLTPNVTVNDDFCAKERIPPRLTFQAHMAPLDIKFFANGTTAFVSFHGSWNRNDPIGYKVSAIDFENGSPVPKSDSLTSTRDIFANAELSKCPDTCLHTNALDCPQICFRPVGLALDSYDRLFVTSDQTGELYVLVRTQAPAATSSSSSSSSTSTSSPSSTAGGSGGTPATSSPSPTKSGGAHGRSTAAVGAWMTALLSVFVLL